MPPPFWIWLGFGALQIVVAGFALVLWVRPPPGNSGARAAVFLGTGLLLVLADAAWFWTGGPEGRSPIAMRGGELGAWLSMITAVEVMLLGALLLVRGARPPRGG